MRAQSFCSRRAAGFISPDLLWAAGSQGQPAAANGGTAAARPAHQLGAGRADGAAGLAGRQRPVATHAPGGRRPLSPWVTGCAAPHEPPRHLLTVSRRPRAPPPPIPGPINYARPLADGADTRAGRAGRPGRRRQQQQQQQFGSLQLSPLVKLRAQNCRQRLICAHSYQLNDQAGACLSWRRASKIKAAEQTDA